MAHAACGMGGLSRGVRTEEVPWASVTDPKTGKRKAKIKSVATGLWSRYGNPIVAPDWFLNELPCVPLDGELWAGRGNFQLCRSICGGDEPDPRFNLIQYAVYSSPPLGCLFQSGEIKNTNMVSAFDRDTIAKWIEKRLTRTGIHLFSLDDTAVFDHEMIALRDQLDTSSERVYMLQQIKLPEAEDSARAIVNVELDKIIERGGEGVILRDPHAQWTPKRVGSVLKFKPHSDDEGMIVGFTSGRETDKGSKHLGKIGALILEYEGKRLELAGLTDGEREFATVEMSKYASLNPGQDMPADFIGKHFRHGQKVTFKYRELSDDGIPKEARYFRQRDDDV